MTPEQALQILAQMVAQTHATYADHQMAQTALSVLKTAIVPRVEEDVKGDG